MLKQTLCILHIQSRKKSDAIYWAKMINKVKYIIYTSYLLLQKAIWFCAESYSIKIIARLMITAK